MTSGSFRLEKELSDRLPYALLAAGDDNRVYYRREVPIGECIPDLVYVTLSQPLARNIWPVKWAYMHSYITWLLRRRNRLQPKRLAALCHEELDRIQPVIRDLIRSGAILQLETHALSLSDELRTMSGEVVAVEAKLKRWKEALEQAKRYKRFSDRVIVAMDINHLPSNSSAIDEFRSAAVGLCGLDGVNIKWLARPIKKPVSGAEKEYLLASVTSQSRQTLWTRR